MAEKTIKYTTKEITVYWKPELCIHAAECVKGLPEVFNPEKKPWVNINAAPKENVAATIDKCPSGALSYKLSSLSEEANSAELIQTKIKVLENGPLIVEGDFNLLNSGGNIIETKNKIALCRCGASENEPFCDGSHLKINFSG